MSAQLPVALMAPPLKLFMRRPVKSWQRVWSAHEHFWSVIPECSWENRDK